MTSTDDATVRHMETDEIKAVWLVLRSDLDGIVRAYPFSDELAARRCADDAPRSVIGVTQVLSEWPVPE